MELYNVFLFGKACDFNVPLPSMTCHYYSDIAYAVSTNGAREYMIPTAAGWRQTSEETARARFKKGA